MKVKNEWFNQNKTMMISKLNISPIAFILYLRKNTTITRGCIRETSAYRYHGGLIDAPLKPLEPSQPYISYRGVKGEFVSFQCHIQMDYHHGPTGLRTILTRWINRNLFVFRTKTQICKYNQIMFVLTWKKYQFFRGHANFPWANLNPSLR